MSAPASIFTRIINGEIPSHRVYEDELVVSFLDIGPLSRGHLLVVPREARAHLHELSEASAAALGRALPIVAAALMRVTGCRAYNVLINNGAEAGQEVMHVHAHVIPRYPDGSGLRKEWRAGTLDPAVGAELATQLREAIRNG